MKPIDTGGIVVFTGAGDYTWKPLASLVAIPAEATAMLVQASGMDSMYMLSPDEIPNFPYPGITIPDGGTTFQPGADNLHAFCILDTGATIAVQFYSGPLVGPMPTMESTGGSGGGGGGGGVTAVTATLPLQSSGGSSPNINIQPGTPLMGDILFFDGTEWTRMPSRQIEVLYVSEHDGYDPYPQAGNYFQPFSTIEAAEAAATPNTIIYIRPGNYFPVDPGSGNVWGKDGVIYYCEPGVKIVGQLRDHLGTSRIRVFGHADLEGVNGLAMVVSSQGSNVYVECNSIEAGALPSGVMMQVSEDTTTVLRVANGIVGASDYCIQMLGGSLTIYGDVDGGERLAQVNGGTLHIHGRSSARDTLLARLFQGGGAAHVEFHGPVNADAYVIHDNCENMRVIFHEDINGQFMDIISATNTLTVEIRQHYNCEIYGDKALLILGGAAHGEFGTIDPNPGITGTGDVLSLGSWANRPIDPGLTLTGQYNVY